MDSFYVYLKKQLLAYVEAEHKKGVPLETIENALINAGHDKNIVDEVISQIKKEVENKKVAESKEPVKRELESNLKEGIFSYFGKENLAKQKKNEIKEELNEITKESDKLVEEVIEEAEIIEEKTILEGITFFIYLIIIGVVIVLISGYSNSQIVNVFFGFLPTIINCFVSLFLVYLSDNVPLYMMIPLLISGLFYVLGKFVSFSLFSEMQLEPLASINFVFSFIYNFLLTYVRAIKPSFMKKKVVKKPNTAKNNDEKNVLKTNLENKSDSEKNFEHNKEKLNQMKINENNLNNNLNDNKNLNNNIDHSYYVKKERKEISELKKEFGLK